MNFAPNRGFSRSGNLTATLQLTSYRTLLPLQRKFGNFNAKLAITRLIQEVQPRMLHRLVRQFNSHVAVYTRPTPVAVATKI